MSGIRVTFVVAAFLFLVLGSALLAVRQTSTIVSAQAQSEQSDVWRQPPQNKFDLEVLVDGRPLAEYYARGRTYIEALKGAEYELRITNPTGERVAVALSVDGLNTIDARHASAWNSSKWVIEPFQTITIGGWQMSSERARRFYFTDERDSYGAKLGQTANLGIIAAVIFRERDRPVTIIPPSPMGRDDRQRGSKDEPSSSANSRAGEAAKSTIAPIPDGDYAATGIGRSVHNDVRWVDMKLDTRPVAELALRYEFYSELLKLGVVPRRYNDPYPVRRREDSRGFSPEP